MKTFEDWKKIYDHDRGGSFGPRKLRWRDGTLFEAIKADILKDMASVRIVSPLWQPIATAPRDGTYVLLGGPSGYVNTSIRCEVGYYDPEVGKLFGTQYVKGVGGWRTHSNDHFTDGGDKPTCWLPLPENGKEFAK